MEKSTLTSLANNGNLQNYVINYLQFCYHLTVVIGKTFSFEAWIKYSNRKHKKKDFSNKRDYYKS
jgi:hypothetical protein